MLNRMSSSSRLYWTARTALYVAAELRIPYLPREKLDALRNARIRRIVTHAYNTVPFYREAMNDRGLRPADVRTVADLELLPVIDGRDLAMEPRRFLSTAFPERSLLALTTSGSSGYAKEIFWDKEAVFRARAAGLRQWDVLASFVGHRHGVRTVTVDRRGGTREHVQAFHEEHSWIPSVVDTLTVQVSPEETFDEALKQINDCNPEVIMGFGAYIGAIYRWAWGNDRHVARPTVICYGGEHMPESDRRLLESSYDVPVINSYQACEAQRIAFQCEKARGMHVFVDQTEVRIADSNGATLPPGKRGRVLISNLINRATVLLNYDIGDVGTMAAIPCTCGRTLPVLESIDGRLDDFVALPGGEVVHESVALSALYAVPGVARIQIIQEGTERLRVLVVCGSKCDWNVTLAGLERALAGVLGSNGLAVVWEQVDDIKPGPGGKFKSIVSLNTDVRGEE